MIKWCFVCTLNPKLLCGKYPFAAVEGASRPVQFHSQSHLGASGLLPTCFLAPRFCHRASRSLNAKGVLWGKVYNVSTW